MGSLCAPAQVVPLNEPLTPDTPTSNWHECKDEYNETYYYNSVTKESSYKRPDELITHERRMNQNYYSIASDFEERQRFCKDEDGNFDLTLKCCLCDESLCTTVIHPCQHFCLCDTCVRDHNIGPPQLGPRSRQMPSETRWSMCPVCMGEITKLTGPSKKEINAYEKYAYSAKVRLPNTFMTKFAYAANKFEKQKRKKLKNWDISLPSPSK